MNFTILEIKIYKIWDTERQLFFKGGWSNHNSDYGKGGKTWNTMTDVKNYLRQRITNFITLQDERWLELWIKDIPETWEVIEFSSITGEKRFKAKDLYPLTNE